MYRITDRYCVDIDERQWTIKELTGERIDAKTKEKVPNYASVKFFGNFKSLKGFLEDIKKILHSEKVDKTKIKEIDDFSKLIQESDEKIKKLVELIKNDLCKFEVERIKEEYEDEILKLREQLKNKKEKNNEI